MGAVTDGSPRDATPQAESDAVRAVRDRAVQVAIAAASEVLASQSGAADRSAGIDRAAEEGAVLPEEHPTTEIRQVPPGEAVDGDGPGHA